ncbi:hypothetical protein [Parasediminibacterium sp. JCM 36343]|uniref:hypothetical protein n=1 Tax=Parasediminibacterium sp. JCM 36343 TaxID=3374279 RepID=UPI00397971C2
MATFTTNQSTGYSFAISPITNRHGTVAGSMELSVANTGYSHHVNIFAFCNPHFGITPKDIDDSTAKHHPHWPTPSPPPTKAATMIWFGAVL